MKNIYYCSSMHGDKYPSNTRSKFTTSIHPKNLDFHTNDPIEVAVKSVLFDSRISHNDIESFNEIPDIILINKIPKSEELLDSLQVGNDVAFMDYGDTEILWGKSFAYVFDRRGKEEINEFGMKDFAITHFHKGFTSLNFLFKPLDDEYCTVFQLLYIDKTKFSSFWDFKAWYNTIYQNVVFKFENNSNSRVYFGENLIKFLSINPGSKIQKIERLSDLIDEEVDSIDEHVNEILNRIVNYNYYQIEENAMLFDDENLLKPLIFGLRSNICEHSIRNNKYDQVIAIIDNSSLGNIKEIEFKNPTFYPTSKEKLSQASFEIFDLLTDKQPNFDIGSPTIINCVVRKMNQKNSFSILLDSSCKDSNIIYKNSPMDFTIELAERIYIPENWGVSLKSLFLTNSLYNISSDKFFFSYSEELKQKDFRSEWREKYTKTGVTVGDGSISHHSYETSKIPDRYIVDTEEWEYEYKFSDHPLPAGCYESLDQLVAVLQNSFDKNQVRLNIKVEGDNLIVISLKEDVVGGRFKLSLSPYLSFTLGLTENIDKSFEYMFETSDPYSQIVDPKLKMLNPKYLFVCCDIVEDTIFSGEHVKLLRLLVNVEDSQFKIMNYDFLQPDTKNVKIREFSSIHVTITDITGKPLLTDSIIPTILQLEFTPL